MCILSFLPEEVGTIDTDVETGLYNGGISNPDGHGWAIADNRNGIMVVGHSLNLDEAVEGFRKARKNHVGPALFHSRWATHGSVREGNCHPFMVGGSHQTVLAHNGILPANAHPAKGDDRSDTAILAEDIIPAKWFRFDKPTVIRDMTQWAGGGNKIVILTVDPRYKKNHYMINPGKGTWDPETGVWHSNYDYMYSSKWRGSVAAYYGAHSYTYTPKSNKSWENDVATIGARAVADAHLEDMCTFCKQEVNKEGYCMTCGTCQDCLEEINECQCVWVPTGAGEEEDVEDSDWQITEGDLASLTDAERAEWEQWEADHPIVVQAADADGATTPVFLEADH